MKTITIYCFKNNGKDLNVDLNKLFKTQPVTLKWK